MTDPDREPPESGERESVALWIVVGLMALIVVGGLTYGLSHPALYGPSPQTVGSAPSKARPGDPM